MSEYHVTATRWSGGWEIHVDGEGVTQVRTLDRATQQVRYLLATLYDSNFDAAEIEVEVVPDEAGLIEHILQRIEDRMDDIGRTPDHALWLGGMEEALEIVRST